MENSEIEEKVVNKITKEDLFFKKSLYEKIDISGLEKDIFSGEVDGFSPNNKIETTYKITHDINYLGQSSNKFYDTRYNKHIVEIMNLYLSCKRKDEKLFYFIIINSEKGYIEKIGQYPSVADMVLSKLKNDYSKILGKDWKNFTKAIGLFSHGIGIGSFVYLRRIFEELIFETFEDNKEKIGFSESEFEILRMNEKIGKIKDFLPDFLVENKELYGILSNGIHELSEEDCLEYFPVIQDSIELILDQKIRIKEKQTREKEMKDKIKNITSKIK